MNSLGDIKVGLQTGENTKFLRYWWEVDFNNIGFSSRNCEDSKKSQKKWFPYNKGGDYRKWYGNQEFIVNWENDGYEIRNIVGPNGRIRSRAQNTQFYFHESLSWSKISSGKIAFRYYPNGFIFDVAGCSVFVEENPILLKSTSHQYLRNLLLSAVAKPCFTSPNDSNFVLLSYNFFSRLIFLDFLHSFVILIFWNFA